MIILIFEDNLFWSARLVKALQALGHQAMLYEATPDEIPPADLAIVNLASQRIDPNELLPKLKAKAIRILAHAGHKETERLELGKQLGCDQVVSNSILTFKLEYLLAQHN